MCVCKHCLTHIKKERPLSCMRKCMRRVSSAAKCMRPVNVIDISLLDIAFDRKVSRKSNNIYEFGSSIIDSNNEKGSR